jgi:hypothetical protein
MLHAYRLLYCDHLEAPDSLWEWHQPWIDHLLWHARTFGREVVHRYFATWHAWLVDYRALLVITREVYEGHHGQRGTPWRP